MKNTSRWDALRDFNPTNRSFNKNRNTDLSKNHRDNHYKQSNLRQSQVTTNSHLKHYPTKEGEDIEKQLVPLTEKLMEKYVTFGGNPSEEEVIFRQIDQVPVGSLTTSAKEKIIDVRKEWFEDRSWTVDRAMYAERLLFRMEQEEKHEKEIKGKTLERNQDQDHSIDIAPYFDHYVNVLNAYACSRDNPINGQRAQYILNHLTNRYNNENRLDLRPNRVAINTTIGAHCKSNHEKSAIYAERLLHQLEILYEKTRDPELRPNLKSYSKVIDAYARKRDAESAHQILLRMMTEYENGNNVLKPSVIIYTNVMDSLAKSHLPDAPERAEKLLFYMLDSFTVDNSDQKNKNSCKRLSQQKMFLDCPCFSVVVDAWAKSRRKDKGRNALRILRLMEKYLQPDLCTYNIVINALSEEDDDLHHAEELVHFIEQSEDLMVDSFTYNPLLKAYFHQAQRKGADGARKAQNLIWQWQDHYNEGKTKDAPDSYSFYALIKAWGMTYTSSGVSKAEDVLCFLERSRNGRENLSRECYNAVIHSWGKIPDRNALHNAERIFQKLESRYRDTGDTKFKPDRYSYLSLLQAYSRNSDYERPHKAEEILYEMLNNYDLPNPDHIIFNEVISAWGRSELECSGDGYQAGDQADILVELMLSKRIPVDAVNMNAVIVAHLNTFQNQVQAQVAEEERTTPSGALRALQKMKELGIKPSPVTYSVFFKISCVIDDSTNHDIFNECIKEGMFNDKVLKTIMEKGCKSIKNLILNESGSSSPSLYSLPREWSVNSKGIRGGEVGMGKAGRQRLYKQRSREQTTRW